MDNITIPAKTIAAKTVAVTPKAAAAINQAKKLAEQIDVTRDRLSDLAEMRADAIRVALDAGLSQADVGRLLGISGQAVNNILRQH